MKSNTSASVERGLVLLIAVAAGALALLLLLGLGLTGAATGLDPRILGFARSLTGEVGPIVALAKGITAFGNDVTLWTVTLIGAGFLFTARDRVAALHLAMVAGTGGLLTTGIKLLVNRPRPGIVRHLVDVHPPSFPSGHAMNSAFVYGTLALIGVRAARIPGARRYITVAAVLMIVLIGTSRVVLGVHWPSDVLTGWVLGTGWAVLGGRVAARVGAETITGPAGLNHPEV